MGANASRSGGAGQTVVRLQLPDRHLQSSTLTSSPSQYSTMAPKKGSRTARRMTTRATSGYDSPEASSSESSGAQASRTQQVIQALLRVGPTSTGSGAQAALMSLEVRDLPPGLSVEELSERRASRSCCFSLSSTPCAWSSHTLCTRCAALNHLIQSESNTCFFECARQCRLCRADAFPSFQRLHTVAPRS